MIQVPSFPFSSETNAAVYSHCSFVASVLAAKLTLEEQSLCADFSEKVNLFQDELDKVSLTYGARVKKADGAVDNAWIATNHQIKANVLHYLHEIKEAAEQVNAVFSRFENPTRLSFKKKYGLLDRLITELRDLPRDVLETAGIEGWLEQLEQRVAHFREIQQRKYETQTETEKGQTSNAREALLASYNELVLQINARLVLHPTDSLIDAAQQWCGYLEEQRAILKASNTRKKKAAENAAAEKKSPASESASPEPLEDESQEIAPVLEEVDSIPQE